VPKNSRLAEVVKDVTSWSKGLNNWQEMWEKINKRYGKYHFVVPIYELSL